MRKRIGLWFVVATVALVPTVSFAQNCTVAAGQWHSLAVKPDGTVWAWGDNMFGQLGNGTNSGPPTFLGNTNYTPIHVSNITAVAAIAAGWHHSLALRDDGTVWAWGENSLGQLGDGTFINRNLPVQVSGISNAIAIAAGNYHSLAIKADGTAWAWGDNVQYKLGDTCNCNYSAIPVLVSNGFTNLIAIAGGESHSLAVKLEGTAWGWGQRSCGQLD